MNDDGHYGQSAFLDRLRAGEPTLMLGIRTTRSTDIVRIAQAAGYDSVMVDLEHATMPLDLAGALCATANDLGLTPFVRVREREYGAIGPLLDSGAAGIIAPRIETSAEALRVVRACRFPPRGQRSAIATVPQVGMRPMPARELTALLDQQTVIQILLETPAGIANAEAIAEIDGVDMLAVGVNDLTAELGIPGQHDDPRVSDAIATVAAACRRNRKLLMVGGRPEASLSDPPGVCPLYVAAVDTELLFTAARDRAERVLSQHAGRMRTSEQPERA